ncbi:MAG: hypothetical protein ACR2OZ_00925 [Verrucomicrobiales bacterium]
MSKVLPRLNPFVPYLRDAYFLLNEALMHEAEDADFAGTLARSSTFHAVSALHAAANSSLWSEDQQLYETATLAYKFEMYLKIIVAQQLEDLEVATLHELEIVSQILVNPQVAQARDFPHPERTNLVEFERTPVKKISYDASHWVPAYAGASLGLAAGFLSRFYRERCGFDVDKLEILFGTHACNDDRYTLGFDDTLLRRLRDERDTLLANDYFLELMASPRWKVDASEFALELFDGCPAFL